MQPPVGLTIEEEGFCEGGDGLYDVNVEGALSHIGDLGVYSTCVNVVVTSVFTATELSHCMLYSPLGDSLGGF
jgi:hypothetical protein